MWMDLRPARAEDREASMAPSAPCTLPNHSSFPALDPPRCYARPDGRRCSRTELSTRWKWESHDRPREFASLEEHRCCRDPSEKPGRRGREDCGYDRPPDSMRQEASRAASTTLVS